MLDQQAEDVRSSFRWIDFDVTEFLPDGWRDIITKFAGSNYVKKDIIPTSITSRESSAELVLPCEVVGGKKIRQGLPWLFDLYTGQFLDLARRFTSEEIKIARDDRYAINLNVQRGLSMRYECHVDSNPVEGLLYVTTHQRGSGGELVVSNDLNARGPEEIDTDSIRIYPRSGRLLFFDARFHPHYVTPLVCENDVRIVVAMNYYTPSCTEDDRPTDLNKHLGLD
jgi:hypothetical protein